MSTDKVGFNWKNELSIRGLKMLDIAYLFAGASIVGYTSGKLLSNLFKFDKSKYEKNIKGKTKLAIQILLEMALIGIVIYASRQIIQAMPFPFDGWKGLNPPENFKGYNHKSLKEYANPPAISFFIILFQDSLKAKIAYFTELNNF